MTRARLSRAVTIVAAAVLVTVGFAARVVRVAHAQDLVWTAEAVPPEPNEKVKLGLDFRQRSLGGDPWRKPRSREALAENLLGVSSGDVSRLEQTFADVVQCHDPPRLQALRSRLCAVSTPQA